MGKLQKDIKQDVVTPLQQKRLMKLNRLLSSKYVLAILSMVVAVGIFMCCNFLLNVFTNTAYLLTDPKRILRFSSFFSINPRFWGAYLLILGLIVIAVFMLVYKIRTAYKDLNVHQKGSERWTTLDEIKQQYRSVPEKGKEFFGKGGVPVCWVGNEIYIDDSAVNTLVIGITRAGKGETYTYPTIDIYSRSSEKPSMVVLDPKLDEYPTCYHTLTKRGYDVYLLNLDNPLKSMAYNPLQLMVDEYKAGRVSEAELLCQTFCHAIFHQKNMENVREPFFPDGSTNVLFCLIWSLVEDNCQKDQQENFINQKKWEQKQKAFETLSEKEKEMVREKIRSMDEDNRQKELLYFRYIPPEIEYQPVFENEKKVTMNSAITLFLTLTDVEIPQGKKTITALEVYFAMRPVYDKSRIRFASIKSASANQKGNLYQYMAQQITVYMLDSVAKFTARNTLKIKDIGFGEKPVAVFLTIPDYDDSLHLLATTYIDQIYFALSKEAARCAAKRCKRDVIFYLEEVGNVPEIKNLRSGITMGQSRGLKFILSLQAYSQLEAIYGEKDANTIIGNCGNQVYIKTDDLNTAKQFSGLIGSETITNVSRMGAKLSINKTFTETYEAKPLLNENELMDLQEKCCVIKRTMRRRDINGQPIPREFPIYNHGETAFKMRHEYMEDDFPSNVDLATLPTGDNSTVDLAQYTFDVEAFFAELDEFQNPVPEEYAATGGGGSPATVDIPIQQPVKKEKGVNVDALRDSQMLVEEIPHGKLLLSMLENMLHISVEGMTIGQAIAELEIAEASRVISETNKDNLLSLIVESEFEV